jgi:hypothetical protein
VKKANLSKVNLNGATLIGVDLHKANLIGADLQDAVLREALVINIPRVQEASPDNFEPEWFIICKLVPHRLGVLNWWTVWAARMVLGDGTTTRLR